MKGNLKKPTQEWLILDKEKLLRMHIRFQEFESPRVWPVNTCFRIAHQREVSHEKKVGYFPLLASR